MFGTSDDYHQLNAGAHRERATNFNAPAVIWHIGFWRDNLYSETIDNAAPVRDETKSTVDQLIVAICKVAKNLPDVSNFIVWPKAFDKIILFDRVFDAFTFNEICTAKTADRHLTKRMKDILVSDNRVVSIKFMWHTIGITIRFEIHTEYVTITTFAEGLDRITDKNPVIFSNYRRLIDYMNGHEALWPSVKAYWYLTFWSDFAAFALPQAEISTVLKADIFKRVFADFRGLVLSDEVVTFPDAGFFDGGQAPTWGSEAQRRGLPIVAPQEVNECTVSYMLGGRALYMTALGPQPADTPDDTRIPVEYFLYVHQRHPVDRARKIVNRWQAGRLVDRVHRLGTARLASLKELSALRDASIALAGLDSRVKRARDAVEQSTTGNDRRAIVCIEDAHHFFNNITTEFNRQTNSRSGLLYRIERSRYYVEQFKSDVRTLGLERVSGYQKYDEFIERRLGSNFDFIDRLGKRYERAVNSLNMLNQNYLTIKTNLISDKAATVFRRLLEVQIYAELFLLAVLVPYYVSSLAGHLLTSDINREVVTIAVWATFFGYALARFKASGTDAAFSHWIAAGWAVVIAILLVVVTLVDHRGLPTSPSAGPAPQHAAPAIGSQPADKG